MSFKCILQRLCATTLLFASSAAAQDITQLGGDLTSNHDISVALELPTPNIRSEEWRQFHLLGHTPFHQSFDGVKLNGKAVLGPNFNHNSCGGCHLRNIKGRVRLTPDTALSTMLVRVALRGTRTDGSPRGVPGVGEQLQDRTIKGQSRFNIRLSFKNRSGRYPDGTSFSLRSPLLTFKIPGIDTRKVRVSLRMTPPIIGVGLLEAVTDETIIAMSDPNDLDGDGISGRVSYVHDRASNTTVIGRFGFRASNPNIRQQSAAAFFFDMGMTNELFQDSKQQQEVSTETLDLVEFYQQAAGVIPARDQANPDVIAGKQLFQQLNCSGCHKMTLQSGDGPVQETAHQTFHPFTDLLLHDMGPELADTRPEFSASNREWRTTPLWGLGLAGIVSTNKPGFLHDGRGRTVEEAILWHGGEAATSRDQFKALSATERQQVIRFLQSL